jgi:DNA-binding transcriptional regulator YhcF (GntR family)
MDFHRVGRVTAAKGVAEQILVMIRRGHLKPGDQLPPEGELMEKLSVGRSSVREAMQTLATLNVVSSQAGSGTFVRQPKSNDILRPDVLGFLIGNEAALELREARQMIEPACIRLFASLVCAPPKTIWIASTLCSPCIRRRSTPADPATNSLPASMSFLSQRRTTRSPSLSWNLCSAC